MLPGISQVEKVFAALVVVLVGVFTFAFRKCLGNEKRLEVLETGAAILEERQALQDLDLHEHHQEVVKRLESIESWLRSNMTKLGGGE